eukprot:365675-Chlamydomonas_euryale.AAC.6
MLPRNGVAPAGCARQSAKADVAQRAPYPLRAIADAMVREEERERERERERVLTQGGGHRRVYAICRPCC